MTTIRTTIVLLLAFGIACGMYAPPIAAAEKEDSATEPDSLVLEGGKEGTVFESLRVEGEDRVRVEFLRPTLNVNLDARRAPGLDWEGIRSVLEAHTVDLTAPYMARSAGLRGGRYARPWLQEFAQDRVARFRPAVEGVDRWRLMIANSHGETVATFDGKGKPPKQISWNGLTSSGDPAPPGLTYSYVLEAYDKAGNKRNFVGEGFELPPYILQNGGGAVMLFSGDDLLAGDDAGSTLPAPILLEAASWLNQTQVTRPVRVQVTARSFKQAQATANGIVKQLTPMLLGNPERVRVVTNVENDAPPRGTVAIVVEKAAAKR